MEKKTKKRTIPNAEADFIVLGKNIAQAWKKYPELTLRWTKPQQFEEAVNALELSFDAGQTVKGERSIVTATLQEINRTINRDLAYVKSYLADEYSKKNAIAYYAQYGIIKLKGGKYGLPNDNDKRLFALQQLVASVNGSPLHNRRYGYTYWSDLLTRFEAVKSQAVNDDSAVSQHINDKQEQKTYIRQTLNALLLLIRANWPQQWREEMRIWGFQKEKY
ncbi:MAG: hypothetical protein LBD27_01165 [Tannerella sp.]|jgi:hypothetical protein|nr:hypothetical protein [Tannerella sp.]